MDKILPKDCPIVERQAQKAVIEFLLQDAKLHPGKIMYAFKEFPGVQHISVEEQGKTALTWLVKLGFASSEGAPAPSAASPPLLSPSPATGQPALLL